MEKIKASVDANYCDRKITGDDLEINFDKEENSLWFNICISNDKDDYMTVSVALDDLMHALGKAIIKEDN